MNSEWLEFTDEQIADLTDAELVEFDRLVQGEGHQITMSEKREQLFEWISWMPEPVESWVSWKGSDSRPAIESVLAEASDRPPTNREIQFAKYFAMSLRIQREKASRVRLMLESARLSLGLTHQEIAKVTDLEPEVLAEIEQGRAWSPRPDLFEPTCSIEGRKEARHLSRTPWMPLSDLRLCRTIREVTVDRSWISDQEGTVIRLARAIREGRSFDRLPSLGVALEAAGCDNREILDHCRAPGFHAAGCWVVDALVRAGRSA
jgi:hypothetical protein